MGTPKSLKEYGNLNILQISDNKRPQGAFKIRSSHPDLAGSGLKGFAFHSFHSSFLFQHPPNQAKLK
jgi:hypothetical protein